MKKFIVFITVICLYGCSVSLTPLKGKYPVEYAFESSKSSDKICSNIKQYCAKNSLKVIEDKNTGTLIAEDTRLVFFTFENADGTPKITNAHIVIGCEKQDGKYKCLEPETTRADISFKVKESSNGSTVSISLINLKSSWGFNNKTGQPYYFRDVKSTGVYEREIADVIK